MNQEILKPAIMLVLWSLVMLAWLVVVRMPALQRAGIDVRKVVGGRPGALDGVIADKAQWPAHNYIHLMEQPTLFYAACAIAALAGLGGGLNALLAWAYVLLRIAHSVVQATINRVLYRFLLFAASSTALIALAVSVALGVFGAGT